MEDPLGMIKTAGAEMRGAIADNILLIDLAHFVIMAQSVRSDYGVAWSRRHPLACWFSTVLCSFSGTFLTNFLLGESLLAPFTSNYDMIVCTVVWYAVFYSPFDAFQSVASFRPAKIFLCVTKELQRAHKVHLGVRSGIASFPGQFTLHVIVGTTKGAGSGVIKSVQQWLHGSWRPHENEIMKPSATSKGTILSAILFALDPLLDSKIAYLSACGILVGLKSLSLFGLSSPLSPIEGAVCRLLFGSESLLPQLKEADTVNVAQHESHDPPKPSPKNKKKKL